MGLASTKIQNSAKDDINWYRSPIDEKTSTLLHRTSDLEAWKQVGGFLGSLFMTAFLALWLWYRLNSWFGLVFVFLYGMQANFIINGVHELGHGTVFRTKFLNTFFMRLLSFLGWFHPDLFFSSHFRHHRYTQNFPLDQENPPPITFEFSHLYNYGIINLRACYDSIRKTWIIATGEFPFGFMGSPTWEKTCYPPDQRHLLSVPINWARVVLTGHILILLLSLATNMWLISIIFSCGHFCGGFLQMICNATQHIGLKQESPDFRLNTRSFKLHPIIAFYYFHMNWHIEHHMYQNVPCYNLSSLHESIKDDLPPTYDGIRETWENITQECDIKTGVMKSTKSK